MQWNERNFSRNINMRQNCAENESCERGEKDTAKRLHSAWLFFLICVGFQPPTVDGYQKKKTNPAPLCNTLKLCGSSFQISTILLLSI